MIQGDLQVREKMQSSKNKLLVEHWLKVFTELNINHPLAKHN